MKMDARRRFAWFPTYLCDGYYGLFWWELFTEVWYSAEEDSRYAPYWRSRPLDTVFVRYNDEFEYLEYEEDSWLVKIVLYFDRLMR